MNLVSIAWYYKAIGAALLLAGLFVAEQAYEHHIYQEGFDAAKAIADQEKADIKAEALSNQLAYEARARTKEQNLVAALATKSTQLQESESHAKNLNDQLRASVRDRSIVLSVPAKCPGADVAAGSGSNSSASGQSGAEGRAELMPEAAIALIDIAADGERAMRKANALIDAYNAIRTACVVGVKP